MKLQQRPPARTPRQFISDRERHAWRSALASCHGVSALLVDVPDALRAVSSSRPLHKHVVSTRSNASATQHAALIEPLAWPFLPQSFDAVLLAWTPTMARRQPRVLTEIDLCLADDGRVLLHLSPAHLAQWCRSGMAQAQALGWQLQHQYWGDRRRFTLLPEPVARYWVAPWQRYVPVAQWCVQLWQKQVCRPTPLRDANALSHARWSGPWPAQQRQRTPLTRKLHD